MSSSIIAVFNTPDEALAAVRRLVREGFARDSITLMSSEPVHEEVEEIGRSKPSRISTFAIIGGIFGASMSLLLTIWTSRQVNIVTGGMPIVAPWAFGIIVFELTALGAIVSSLACMIYESRLTQRSAFANYDEAVADGKIVIAIDRADDDQRNIAERVLAESNAELRRKS